MEFKFGRDRAACQHGTRNSLRYFPLTFLGFFTTIYANPISAERCVLWNNLSKVVDMHNKSWVIARDFNKPLIDEDKFGGKPVSINRSLLFKACLDKCNMMDLEFNGPRFTWTNKRDANSFIQERIY